MLFVLVTGHIIFSIAIMAQLITVPVVLIMLFVCLLINNRLHFQDCLYGVYHHLFKLLTAALGRCFTFVLHCVCFFTFEVPLMIHTCFLTAELKVKAYPFTNGRPELNQ